MKRVDAARAGKVCPALIVALVLMIALSAVAFAKPSDLDGKMLPPMPEPPHQFYGRVYTDKGTPLLAGTEVMAKALTGAWTGSVTTTVEALEGYSRYGYAPIFQIPAASSSDPTVGAAKDAPIAFYVDGVRARLLDKATNTWSDTYRFQSGGITELDLQVKLEYTITPTAGTGCTITPGTPQTVSYLDDISFTIAANTGYDIENVTVNGVSKGPITSYTFTDVTDNGAISATCKLKTYTITPIAGTGGTITPGTPVIVEYGKSQTFIITPNLCYVVDKVIVNNVDMGAITTYTFTDVKADGSIVAAFRQTCVARYTYLPFAMK